MQRFSSLFSDHAIGSFSIIDLAFCQSKLTTHSYSSSGFSILHSAARFHSTDPKNKSLSLSSSIRDFPVPSSLFSSSSPHTSLSSLSTETMAGTSMLLLSTSKDRLRQLTTTTTIMEVNPSKITTNFRSLPTSSTFLFNVTSLETSILMTNQGIIYFFLLIACVVFLD